MLVSWRSSDGRSAACEASISAREITRVDGSASGSFCSTEPAVTKVFARATFFADNRADLPRVKRPCLILQHRRDTLAPLAVGEHLHAQLRDSTLQVLDVAGHCSHMTHPALVIDAMRAYIGQP